MSKKDTQNLNIQELHNKKNQETGNDKGLPSHQVSRDHTHTGSMSAAITENMEKQANESQ